MQETPTTFFRTMKQNLHFVSPWLSIMGNEKRTKWLYKTQKFWITNYKEVTIELL